MTSKKPSESEYFELLSAYLDGEVTTEESQKIEQLLQNDENCRHLYNKLLKLKKGIRKLPCPTPQIPPEQLSAKIFTHVRQQNHRRKWLWGSGAIAALSIFALSGLLTKNSLYSPQLAYNQNQSKSELLMIAINRPTVTLRPNKAFYSQSQLMLPLNRPAVDIPQ